MTRYSLNVSLLLASPAESGIGFVGRGAAFGRKVMQGVPFAIEAFAAGAGILDWFLFDGHYLGATLRLIGF